VGVDGAREAGLDEEREATRVVDVRVAQDHGVDAAGLEGEGLPITLLVGPGALDESAVEQEAPAADLDEVTGPGDLTRAAVEGDLHWLSAPPDPTTAATDLRPLRLAQK